MEPLKNLFSPELVGCMAGHLKRRHPKADEVTFAATVLQELPRLELKERAQLIADQLIRVLPTDAGERHASLLSMLHPDEHEHANATSDADGLCGWAVLPMTLVVGQHGLADFRGGLEALREMTKRFSSEFGVRYFLIEDQSTALDIMSRWIADPNRHVRRLVSEGTRPRLPWAMQLPALVRDPAPVLPLLQALRDDPEPYVRRSVSNHLNDIAKDHPGLVADLVEKWIVSASPDRRSLLRHACRTLIKRGDSQVLAAFGQHPPRVSCGALELSSTCLAMPGVLGMSVEITSLAKHVQDLTVDYVIHFRKANGSLAPKVFKGSVFSLRPGEACRFRRSHRFSQITTRRHYAGSHGVSLRINGEDTDVVMFDLRV
ncbi:DNA alkylation repair protein [Sinorhizobium meliloti]|nr:DNA alkylation repair protein [Sinorhizobium meliloti]